MIDNNKNWLGAVGSVPRYRPDIDGLKGIAILSVLVFHYVESWLTGGFIGVDIFFVVSGYLIGRSVFESMAAQKFKLSTYFAHRARRIFPSLILMLVILLGFGWFALLPGEYASLGKHTGAASIFISNWLLWREVGYFDTAAELKPLLNLWSLGLEEQFYLIFPFLIVLGLRWRKRVLPILVFVFLASLIGSQLKIHDAKAWAYFHPLSRLWELMAGAILAHVELRSYKVYGRFVTDNIALRQLMSVVGAACLIVAAVLYTKQTIFPGVNALVPVIGAVLLIAAGPQAWVNKYLLSGKLIIGIGLISYPLYLWHWPLLSLVRTIDVAEPGYAAKGLLVLLTVVLSVLSYFLLEKPIRFGRLRPNKFIPAYLWAALLLTGAIGFVIYKNNGFPERLRVKSAPQEVLSFGASSDEKGRVVLLGDSHGLMYENTLKGLYGERGYELLSYSRGGCLPLWNLERHDPGHSPNGCAQSVNQGYQRALEDGQVKEVLIIGSFSTIWNVYDVNHPEQDAVRVGAVHSDDVRLEIFERQLEKSVKMLLDAGKSVVLFQVIPNLDFNPAACEDRPIRFFAKKMSPCVMAREKVAAQQRRYREVFANIAKQHPMVKFFDPVPILCNAQSCKAANDDQLLYSNPTHLNDVGALYVLKRNTP